MTARSAREIASEHTLDETLSQAARGDHSTLSSPAPVNSTYSPFGVANSVFGRVGGEEFLVVVPAADARELEDVLQRIRMAIAETPMTIAGDEMSVTVSLGGATRDGDSADDLIARADDALYGAKQAGRDRVVMAAGV
jgi:GGDEF domain-containing protein